LPSQTFTLFAQVRSVKNKWLATASALLGLGLGLGLGTLTQLQPYMLSTKKIYTLCLSKKAHFVFADNFAKLNQFR